LNELDLKSKGGVSTQSTVVHSTEWQKNLCLWYQFCLRRWLWSIL